MLFKKTEVKNNVSSSSSSKTKLEQDIFSHSSIIQGAHLAPTNKELTKLHHQTTNNNSSSSASNSHLFPISIRFTDTGEIIELKDVSKFWTVGDVSRRVLKLRNQMQERKMGLPGVYFPEDQERILIRFKEKERLSTLNSMEHSLKQKFFYSPARDEMPEVTTTEQEEAAHQQHHRDHHTPISSQQRQQQRRSSLMNATASSASKSPFHNVVGTSASKKSGNTNTNSSIPSPSPLPNNNQSLYNNGNSSPTRSATMMTSAGARSRYRGPDPASYNPNDKEEEDQFFRFHHASDFANERQNGNRSEVNDGGSWSPRLVKNPANETTKNQGTVSTAKTSRSGHSAIRLSVSGTYFNDPHESLEDLGITYEETMKRKRQGEGSLIRLEAEVVQSLIFGRAIVKRV